MGYLLLKVMSDSDVNEELIKDKGIAMSFGDYECPNCGADLELQQGFDPDKGYWTCTECGQQLFGDDEDEASSYRRFQGLCGIATAAMQC